VTLVTGACVAALCAAGPHAARASAAETQLAYRFQPGQELLYRATILTSHRDGAAAPKSIEIVFTLSTAANNADAATLALTMDRVILSYPSGKLKLRLTYDVPGNAWFLNGLPLEGPPFGRGSEKDLFEQIGEVFQKPLRLDITTSGTISNMTSATSFGDIVSRSNLQDVIELLFMPGLPEDPVAEGAKWTRLRRMEGPTGKDLAVRADYELSRFLHTGTGRCAIIDFVASATSHVEDLPGGGGEKELAVLFVLDGHGTVTIDVQRGLLVSSVMEVESSFEAQTSKPGVPTSARRLHSLWRYSLRLEGAGDIEATYK